MVLVAAIVTVVVLAVAKDPASATLNIFWGICGLSIGVLWAEYAHTKDRRSRDR